MADVICVCGHSFDAHSTCGDADSPTFGACYAENSLGEYCGCEIFTSPAVPEVVPTEPLTNAEYLDCMADVNYVVGHGYNAEDSGATTRSEWLMARQIKSLEKQQELLGEANIGYAKDNFELRTKLASLESTVSALKEDAERARTIVEAATRFVEQNEVKHELDEFERDRLAILALELGDAIYSRYSYDLARSTALEGEKP